MDKRLFLMAVATSLGCAQMSAQQQTAADGKDDNRVVELNPVVVTGNGHHQLLKSTTTPVHVISQRLIKETGSTDFQSVLTRLMPQISFSPNAMGSYIRVNGLGNKYVLVLVNGKKMIGDIAGNVDLNRIDMSRVKRIEVLDGAASALYGSDAIGGVINIITEQTQLNTVEASSDTRVSGKGQFSEGVNLDVSTKYLDSHTSYFHQEADNYQNNGMALDSKGNEYATIAPLFIGFNSNLVNQRFDIKPTDRLSLYVSGAYNYKLTDRPDTREDITGGSDYDMRSEGWRMEAGAKYKLGKNHLQFDFTSDNYHYGNLSQVETSKYHVGDFVRSKTIDKVNAKSEMFFVVFYNYVVNMLSVDGWAVLSVMSVVAMLLLLLVYLFGSSLLLRKIGFYGAAVGMLLFAFGMLFAFQQKRSIDNCDVAVVVSPVVNVKKTPADSGSDAFVIHEGTRVHIIDPTMKGWWGIALDDGREGWLKRQLIETVVTMKHDN